jgi:hypothetical protein
MWQPNFRKCYFRQFGQSSQCDDLPLTGRFPARAAFFGLLFLAAKKSDAHGNARRQQAITKKFKSNEIESRENSNQLEYSNRILFLVLKMIFREQISLIKSHLSLA